MTNNTFNTSVAVENALMGQKDNILSRLNDATEVEELQAILTTLSLLAPLWEALEYGYKTREIAQRIAEAADKQAASALDMRNSHSRKNSSQWKLWDREYGQLVQIMHLAKQSF